MIYISFRNLVLEAAVDRNQPQIFTGALSFKTGSENKGWAHPLGLGGIDYR
jgi:hypothetical protein